MASRPAATVGHGRVLRESPGVGGSHRVSGQSFVAVGPVGDTENALSARTVRSDRSPGATRTCSR